MRAKYTVFETGKLI